MKTTTKLNPIELKKVENQINQNLTPVVPGIFSEGETETFNDLNSQIENITIMERLEQLNNFDFDAINKETPRVNTQALETKTNINPQAIEQINPYNEETAPTRVLSLSAIKSALNAYDSTNNLNQGEVSLEEQKEAEAETNPEEIIKKLNQELTRFTSIK